MCLEVTYRYLKNDQHQINVRQKCYYTLDGFVKMAWFVLCVNFYELIISIF